MRERERKGTSPPLKERAAYATPGEEAADVPPGGETLTAGLVDSAAVQRASPAVRYLAAHPVIMRIAIFAVVIAVITLGLVLWLTGRLEIENAGYLGTFLLNLIGSGSIVVPVPGFAAVCSSSAPLFDLNLMALALSGAAGATLGEITGYLLGFGGQAFVSRYRLYARIHHWVLKRGGLALFLLSALPNPFFDIAGIAAGSLGYPLQKFLAYVLAGKVIRFVGIAYACRYGIEWLSRFT